MHLWCHLANAHSDAHTNGLWRGRPVRGGLRRQHRPTRSNSNTGRAALISLHLLTASGLLRTRRRPWRGVGELSRGERIDGSLWIERSRYTCTVLLLELLLLLLLLLQLHRSHVLVLVKLFLVRLASINLLLTPDCLQLDEFSIQGSLWRAKEGPHLSVVLLGLRLSLGHLHLLLLLLMHLLRCRTARVHLVVGTGEWTWSCTARIASHAFTFRRCVTALVTRVTRLCGSALRSSHWRNWVSLLPN